MGGELRVLMGGELRVLMGGEVRVLVGGEVRVLMGGKVRVLMGGEGVGGRESEDTRGWSKGMEWWGLQCRMLLQHKTPPLKLVYTHASYATLHSLSSMGP